MLREFHRELIRKLFQASGLCLVPLGGKGAIFLLICACMELIHLSLPSGLPIFRKVRSWGERDGDKDFGPLMLALGASAVLLFVREPWTWSICGLIFIGDSIAAIIGKLLRGPYVPFSKTKHLAGSASFLGSVWSVAMLAGLSPLHAGILACTGTVVEAYAPAGADNLLLPLSGIMLVAIIDGSALIWKL